MRRRILGTTASSKNRAIVLLIGGLLAMVTLLCGAVVHAGKEVTIEGVRHVQNGSEPSQGRHRIELKELWRAGGEDDEVFFGVVSQVLSDASGNIYLLDTQLSEVQVYSAAGEHLKVLSRQGTGPGETTNPFDMLFMPDGSLGLVQVFPGKIVQIDLQGNPAGTFTPGGADPTEGGFMAVVDAKYAAGNLVLGGVHITVNQEEASQTRTNYLASYGEDEREIRRYTDRERKWEFANLEFDEASLHFPFRRWAMGDQGQVAVPLARDEYAITILAKDGQIERVIEREYQSWPREERDKARANAFMDAQTRQIPVEVKKEIADTEPDITSVTYAPDGSLWVLSSRGAREKAADVMATYDIFAPSGEFIKQVDLVCEHDSYDDGIFLLGADRVIVVTDFVEAFLQLQGGGSSQLDEGEEPAPMQIVCYAM